MLKNIQIKTYISLLIVTSLLGYLEWSTNSHAFLFEAEFDLIKTIISDPIAAINPFTVLPFIGQLILIFCLFQKQPNKYLVLVGSLGLLILLGFMFIIGLLGLNFKILLSTLPFLLMCILVFKKLKKQ